MKNKIIFFILLAFSGNILWAQNPKRPEVNVEELVLNLAPIDGGEGDLSIWIENLHSLYQDPLDINAATEEDLRNIPFLSIIQIRAIIDHKIKFGDFDSLYELQAVQNLNMEQITLLLPFITLNKKLKLSQYFKNAQEKYLVLRMEQSLEKSVGFEKEIYAGSRQKYYSRFRYSSARHFSLGFISEKDAGEKNFFDHYLFHAQIQNYKNIKNLIIGDFTSQFGQGLVLAGGFTPGKGGEPIFSTLRNSTGFKPYSSLGESNYLRGVALSIKNKNLLFSPFISINKRDAQILNTAFDDTEDFTFSSIYSSGLHRTTSELEKKKQLEEKNLGFNLTYNLGLLKIGFSSIYTAFDKKFEKQDQLYNTFEFKGKENLVLGPHLNVILNNLNIFGEAARSKNGGTAYIGGVVAALGPKTEWALNYRNYAKDFQSFYAAGFAEGSRTINESGLYNGLKYNPNKYWQFGAYVDIFKFPWLKYQISGPSSGTDYQFRIDHKPSKKEKNFFVIHVEEKQKNESGLEIPIPTLENVKRRIYAIGREQAINFNLKYQTKIQFNTYGTDSKTTTIGYAIVQDLEGRLKQGSYRFRLAYFNTDSFSNRIYAYENDVLYSVSFPAYYGKGLRYYAIIKKAIHKDLDVWLRLAGTKVYDRKNIGSGNDAVGNFRNDLKIQLKYSF